MEGCALALRCRQPPPRPRIALRRGSRVGKINICFAVCGSGCWGALSSAGSVAGLWGWPRRGAEVWGQAVLAAACSGVAAKAAGRPCQLGRAGADVGQHTPRVRSGCAKVRGAVVRCGVDQRPPGTLTRAVRPGEPEQMAGDGEGCRCEEISAAPPVGSCLRAREQVRFLQGARQNPLHPSAVPFLRL